ncbi:MAG: SDR family oxidoreductase [Acidobacteriota bacterium]|nr:SDR family oxidoreductase [Acidobacteriota bacterium]
MKLDGRRVLVTGGAQGMGLLIAQGAAARGAHVAIWDVNAGALADAAARIRAAHPHRNQLVVSEAVDVGDPDAVVGAAERLAASFGKVDVLINNAGVVSGKPLTELSPEEVQRTLRVNTAALFWTTQAMLPAMIEAGSGHVVTMASAGGLIGVSRLSDYCASKFGAVGFHESLRAELRRTAPGVGASLICPFFVGTGMFAGVRTRFPFLLPILAPEKVAAAVIRAVERNRPVVVLPWFVHSLKLLRLLPVRWLDPIASFFGIHVAMDTFSGRPKSP